MSAPGILALLASLSMFAGSAGALDRETGAPVRVDVREVTEVTTRPRELLRQKLRRAFPRGRLAMSRRLGRPAVLVLPGEGAEALDTFRQLLPEGIEMVAHRGEKGRTVYGFRGPGGVEIHPDVVTATRNSDQLLLIGTFPASARVIGSPVPDVQGAVARARTAIEKGAGGRFAPGKRGRGSFREGAGGRLAMEASAVLFDGGAGLRHGVRVRLPSIDPPGDFEVVVDAAGEILMLGNLAPAIDGTASVYRTSPLDGPVVEEPIRHIEVNGRLEGLHVTVVNEDTPTQASSSTNQFRYPESNKHLDETHVYHHMDRIHDWFEEVHGYRYPEAPVQAVVYYGESYDNAMYMPWGNFIVFGDGARYNVLSRDASVVYHEFTHAITNSIAPLGPGGEAGAMSEGFSDYFAATLTGDPAVGRWIVAKAGRPYLRTCENSLHYPEDLKNDSHDDAPLWAGPLWDLRKRVGAEVADRLSHRCRFALNREATFVAGLEALLAVDVELNAGKHAEAIREIFRQRGIEPAAPLY